MKISFASKFMFAYNLFVSALNERQTKAVCMYVANTLPLYCILRVQNDSMFGEHVLKRTVYSSKAASICRFTVLCDLHTAGRASGWQQMEWMRRGGHPLNNRKTNYATSTLRFLAREPASQCGWRGRETSDACMLTMQAGLLRQHHYKYAAPAPAAGNRK